MKKHIVLIEDDPDISFIIRNVLEEEGYQISSFTALTSLEELIELHADCFLLDENLSGVSGHIICILLKSKVETAKIPVILITAGNKLDTAVSLGNANAGLKKPFEVSDLLGTIATLMD